MSKVDEFKVLPTEYCKSEILGINCIRKIIRLWSCTADKEKILKEVYLCNFR